MQCWKQLISQKALVDDQIHIQFDWDVAWQVYRNSVDFIHFGEVYFKIKVGPYSGGAKTRLFAQVWWRKASSFQQFCNIYLLWPVAAIKLCLYFVSGSNCFISAILDTLRENRMEFTSSISGQSVSQSKQLHWNKCVRYKLFGLP